MGLSISEHRGPPPHLPKGKAGPESGGLSRTVEKFSHNQTQTEPHRAARRTPVHQGDRGREGGKELTVTITQPIEVHARPYLL